MNYIVFGSGGMAKEVIGYLEDDGHKVAYVVSPESFKGEAFSKYRVAAEPGRDARTLPCLMAIADPGIKRQVVALWPQANWSIYWHSSCYISPHATLGRGCIFAPQALVCGDPVLGEFCFFNTNATIGHDSVLGAYSTLFPNTEVCGDCNLGEDCVLGIGAYIVPGVTLPAGSKVSAGGVVRESCEAPANHYGDPRGGYRVSIHNPLGGSV